VSKRNLYYAVRDRIQEHTTRELEAGYFTHTLLPAYEREQAPLPGVYAESRGVLHEPHSDTQIILDDAVVASYIFPAWCYNKVLYVEKRTVWPVLESYRLAERHDMAILTGEGYATEAMHALFANASKNKQYQLFVLHDADPHGYNIARLLQEESLNMRGKGYAVEVFDLGLFIEDAVALGIRLEAFTRKSALPKELVLSEEARRIFEGEKQRGRNEWIGHRVELNALSAPQLVGYIERRLAACGARGKVIPPEAVLTTHLRGGCIQRIATAVQGEVERLLSLDAVTARVQRRFGHILPTAADRTMVEAALARDPARPWTAPLWIHTLDIVNPHYDAIMAAVREELLETIQHGALLGDEASAPADDDVDQADIDEDY